MTGSNARERFVAPSLLVDLYELTMGQSYFDHDLHEHPATFSLFARHLPDRWGYLLAAGLDGGLRYLERLAFAEDELSELERTGLFTPLFLDALRTLGFTGDVRALPEGTPVFPHEPLLEIDAPLLEAQLVESVVLNELHFATLVASKARRCVEAAAGRTLVDFGLRRTHGIDAALKVARASYLAGFDATSNVLAGSIFDIPLAGTMAHSFVQTFGDEQAAFRAFLDSYPTGTLLVDTYDTVVGVEHAVAAARAAGTELRGVRLDSGELLKLARVVRQRLDGHGFEETTIFASGSLDEHDLDRLVSEGAPIDGFGIGSKLGTVADAPFLDMAYKLVEIDGRPTLKLSTSKATWPGRKQVWRQHADDGSACGDVIGLADENLVGDPLLEPVMTRGRRRQDEPLSAGRVRAASRMSAVPPRSRALDASPYPVRFSPALERLRRDVAAGAS